jgi:hypothetical protein
LIASIECAPLEIAADAAAGERLGLLEKRSAASPATHGVAIDVPLLEA